MNGLELTLDQVLADAAARLQAAARDRRSAMHVPVIGTSDGDLRMMVLRACDADLAALRFHTDARSPKASAIGKGAPLSLLGHDPAAKIQLRARGIGRIETDSALAEEAWTNSTPFARRCYLAQAAPGTPVDEPKSGLPAEIEGQMPSEAQLLPARANFAILLLTLTSLDWLHLANTGHRRAQFTRGGAREAWAGQWVVP